MSMLWAFLASYVTSGATLTALMLLGEDRRKTEVTTLMDEAYEAGRERGRKEARR